MEEKFRIVDPDFTTTGDYVSFSIIDGDDRIVGRISRSALAMLDKGNNNEPADVFGEHLEQIREAAFKMRRVNPAHGVIFLATHDF